MGHGPSPGVRFLLRRAIPVYARWMGLFVQLVVDRERCASRPECRECVQSCPVEVFDRNDGAPAFVLGENEDECILCDLCIRRCPVGAVTLMRLY
ncbi:MAG: hypothetical protein Kow0010_22910 [Dehalococcoidia bacterium]